MPKTIVNVIPIRQDGNQLLLTALTAQELIKYTTIDRYDSNLPASDARQGYQRPEETARAKNVAKYVRTTNALLPTAILLNARNSNLGYDQEAGTVVLDSATPLQLVDGQHRVAGFSHAIEHMGETGLLDFEVPVVIMLGLSKVQEMQQFRTVNGTQKSVRTDLVNMILSHIAAAEGEDKIEAKDRWKLVVTRAIERLNEDQNSVWYDKIVMPDETAYSKKQIEVDPSLAGRKIVRATSFMTSLKRLYDYLREYGHIKESWDTESQADELARLINHYWHAVAELCPEPFASPEGYVIQKTPGVFSLHMVCRLLVRDMHTGRRQFVKEEFKFMMEPALEGPQEVLMEHFWRAENGTASAYGSMKGFTDLADMIAGEMGIEL